MVLDEHAPATRRPVLCHGDIHTNNVLGTWSRVTGIIDWDTACIADPEFDIAIGRCNAILLMSHFSRVLGLLPYWIYRAHQLPGLDPKRLRYYEAQRAFLIALFFSSYLVGELDAAENQATPRPPGQRLGISLVGAIVRSHVRHFRRLTGLILPTPVEAAAQRPAPAS